MYATEYDDIGIGFLGLLCEAEGITDVIRDVLDFWDLIIMRENDGIELLLQGINFLGQRGKSFARHGGAGF